MNEAIVVLDFEYTSREPAEAHIIEWAVVTIPPPWFGQEQPPTVYTGLVKPPIPIPPETSSVHHIIDEDVAHMPAWEVAKLDLRKHLIPGRIVVAHKADSEKEVLARHDPDLKGLRWLCSYKAAVRIWPTAPAFSLQALRYYRRLVGENGSFPLGRRGMNGAHSAAFDAAITALLFQDLLAAGAKLEDMLVWTDEPALLPVCPIGDWRGRPWAEVDEGFLHWILRKIHDSPDVRFCAQKELERRDDEWRAQQGVQAGAATA